MYHADMHNGPEVSAKLVLRVNDRVLMLQRPDGRHIFPGGHITWGEPTTLCLKRELWEELSYDLRQEPEFADLYEYISPDRSQHIIILHYLLRLPERPALALGDDEAGSDVLWLTQEKLQKIIPRPQFIEKIFRSSRNP